MLTWGLLAQTAVFLCWIRALLWLTEFASRLVVPLCLLQLDGRFDTLGALYSSHQSHRTDIRFLGYLFVDTCILDLLPVYVLGFLDLFSWTCAVFSLFLHGFGPYCSGSSCSCRVGPLSLLMLSWFVVLCSLSWIPLFWFFDARDDSARFVLCWICPLELFILSWRVVLWWFFVSLMLVYNFSSFLKHLRRVRFLFWKRHEFPSAS